ncbi:response regulator transcription factor [Clostridium sp. UBA1056]|uniref:response regulator transcription factor n=1 Tax=unclassified Clostridium TaxID=2614128 RepID=UPI003217DE76
MKRVLIVEDDLRIGELMKAYFEKSGYDVSLQVDGVEGYVAFNSQEFDLAILDLMLPGLDGFEIAKRIRKTSEVPIIMVTARSDDEAQMLGYNLKIDDYITKPFNPEILLVKANNLMERINVYKNQGKEDIENQFELGDFKVDFFKMKVYIDDEEIKLEPKQYKILDYLIKNKSKVISREELLDKIWGYDYFGSDRVVDTQIRKLRTQLRHKSYLIKTVISIGYTFEED